MTKRRALAFLLLFCMFALGFLLLAFDAFGKEPPPEIYRISVIVRGRAGDRWESIRQGADQAASEMNVDLSFITLSGENDSAEQISLLQREIDAGADAIVLSASDSAALAAPVEQAAEKAPVICIETGVYSGSVSSFISADNYGMGLQLGEEIIASGNARKRLVVVDSSLQCASVAQRRAGLMHVLGRIGGEIEVWTLPDGDPAEASRMLASRIGKKTADVIVTLDTSALELTAQAVSDMQAHYLDLFGIGSTGKIASFIENDIVTATVVQNDFAVGYLGVKAAVDSIQGHIPEADTVVGHQVVNWSNMYDPEVQRLLFPFIR